MARLRKRSSGHFLASLLALAWVPYLLVQCPNCPGAESAFVRCVSVQQPPPDCPRMKQHGRAAVGHAGDADAAPESQPGGCGDCCPPDLACDKRASSDRVAPAGASVVAIAPVNAQAFAYPGRPFDVVVAHRDPVSHSPPRYLLLQSFLC